jgi:hypothetical protein
MLVSVSLSNFFSPQSMVSSIDSSLERPAAEHGDANVEL